MSGPWTEWPSRQGPTAADVARAADVHRSAGDCPDGWHSAPANPWGEHPDRWGCPTCGERLPGQM